MWSPHWLLMIKGVLGLIHIKISTLWIGMKRRRCDGVDQVGQEQGQEQARCRGVVGGVGWGSKTLRCKKGSVVEWSFVVPSPPSPWSLRVRRDGHCSLLISHTCRNYHIHSQMFLAGPRQLKKVTLSLTDSLTPSSTLLKHTTIEHSERLVTLVTL